MRTRSGTTILKRFTRSSQEKRDTADVTDVLKELHQIVNEAIRTQEPGEDHAEGLTVTSAGSTSRS